MSITKTVAYLWITVGHHHRRWRSSSPARSRCSRAGSSTRWRRSTTLARDGIVGSVMKSGKKQWFPYIGGVFLFVLTCNLIGLLPLPFGEHHQPSYYAATANLNVTLMLALFTFLFTHYAGVRKNGALKYVEGLGAVRRASGAQAGHLGHPRDQRVLPPHLALRPSLRQHGGGARHPRGVLRHGAHLPELPRRPSPFRAPRCSSTCSRSSSPSSRRSSSPSSPPCTSAALSTRTTDNRLRTV